MSHRRLTTSSTPPNGRAGTLALSCSLRLGLPIFSLASSSKRRAGGAGECRSDRHPCRSECAARGAPLRAKFEPPPFLGESAPASQTAQYFFRAWIRRCRRQCATAARSASECRLDERRKRPHCLPPVRGAAPP